MGEPYTVTALIVITLGGLGSVSGSLLGGLLLGVVEAVGMHLTSPSLKMVLSYGVFIGGADHPAQRSLRALMVRPRLLGVVAFVAVAGVMPGPAR